ncbi:unnamed protein product, partial [Linum tenue]
KKLTDNNKHSWGEVQAVSTEKLGGNLIPSLFSLGYKRRPPIAL